MEKVPSQRQPGSGLYTGPVHERQAVVCFHTYVGRGWPGENVMPVQNNKNDVDGLTYTVIE